jgi:hypothetical protein
MSSDNQKWIKQSRRQLKKAALIIHSPKQKDREDE